MVQPGGWLKSWELRTVRGNLINCVLYYRAGKVAVGSLQRVGPKEVNSQESNLVKLPGALSRSNVEGEVCTPAAAT